VIQAIIKRKLRMHSDSYIAFLDILGFRDLVRSNSSTHIVNLYAQDDRRLRLVEFTKEFIEPDWCTKGHIGYVLEGQMDVDFAGHVVHFSAGDGLFIPAGEEARHKATVITDLVKLILVEDAEQAN